MAHDLLTEDAQAALARIGSADLVIGVPTAGAAPSLDGVAAAVRAGLQAHFPGQSVAVIHVDQGGADDPGGAAAQPSAKSRSFASGRRTRPAARWSS